MRKDQENALTAFMAIASQTGFSGLFGGMPFGEPKEEYPHERLGDGYELRKIEMVDANGKPVENNSSYSHLYHNDLKVTDIVFRSAMTGQEFKDGYSKLIAYAQIKPHTEKSHGFDFGRHVIINKLGDVCLSGGNSGDYPSHYGGNIGKLKNTYINLLTGEKILTCGSSNTINSQNFIIVEHKYDWYDKELPLGVYKIDKTTCEYTKIDDIQR